MTDNEGDISAMEEASRLYVHCDAPAPRGAAMVRRFGLLLVPA
jgi:hypothetical protein